MCSLLCPGGSGEDEQLTVGEDSVYVEEQEFDFFGAKFCRLRFAHRADSSIRRRWGIANVRPLAAQMLVLQFATSGP